MPVEDLRQGNSKSKASLGANNVSLPPQVLFVRALRSRPFLLTLTCLMTLLSSQLAIAFSWLFQQATLVHDSVVPMKHFFQPFMQNVGFQAVLSSVGLGINDSSTDFINLNTHWHYEDPSFIVEANITRGLSLPAWTTMDYYFISFDATNPLNKFDEPRTVVTQGFGIDAPYFTSNQNPALVKSASRTIRAETVGRT